MKRHLKRLAAPASWNVKRKSTTFIVRPHPSGHSQHLSVSLNMFLREMAGYAKSTKEIKAILQQDVLVNGRKQTDHRNTAGFFDVVEMAKTKEANRIIMDTNGRITHVKIPEKEAHLKICKIIGKTILPKGKVQLNLNDGQNFIVTTPYTVGDSVVVDFKKNTLVDTLKFEKNMTVFLTEGKQKCSLGKIVYIQGDTATFALQSGAQYKTRKSCAFVVGKDHPIITVHA